MSELEPWHIALISSVAVLFVVGVLIAVASLFGIDDFFRPGQWCCGACVPPYNRSGAAAKAEEKRVGSAALISPASVGG